VNEHYPQHLRVDPEWWQRLREADPQEVCRRALVEHQEGRYLVPFLTEMVEVDPQAEGVREGQGEAPVDLAVVSVVYLLRARDLPRRGQWVREVDLEGGVMFFQGPHALRLEPLEQRFGSDPEGFLEAGQRWGGTPQRFGDAAFELRALPRIPLVYVLWAADEEFPARVRVLFDAGASEQLPLDALWGLVGEVTERLLQG